MKKIKIFLLISLITASFSSIAASLPSPTNFNWTYDYWVNKKYLQADNNVYKYTNGKYTARNYVDLVILSLNGTESEKVLAVESLTNLCYLINKNEGLNVDDCLLGKLDSNVNEFLTYVVSLEYHKEKIQNCISGTQSLDKTITGRSSIDNEIYSYNLDYAKANKINECVSLGYGLNINPQKFLTTINLTKDTTAGQVDGLDSYTLNTVNFSNTNQANSTSLNNALSDLDCSYLYKKNVSDYNKYCVLKTLATKINSGITSCADTSKDRFNSKDAQSTKIINGNLIWGVKIDKDPDSFQCGYQRCTRYYWRMLENPNNSYMRKTAPNCSITSKSGQCAAVSCGTNNSNCYSNISCKNANAGNDSYVQVSYPNLSKSYFIYNSLPNVYKALPRLLSFNSNAMNFMINEMGKTCISKNINYYPIVTNSTGYWFGLSDSYKNVFIQNSSGEYLADPKFTGGGYNDCSAFSKSGCTVGSTNPVKNATMSSTTYTYCN